MPLSYIINNSYILDHTTRYIFLESFNGEAYNLKNKQVLVIKVRLVVKNTQVETKIQLLGYKNNFRGMVNSLDEHYISSGVYSHDITKAESIMNNIFESGKKHLPCIGRSLKDNLIGNLPHM